MLYVKDISTGNVFKSAMLVVEEHIQEIETPVIESLRNPDHLVRIGGSPYHGL